MAGDSEWVSWAEAARIIGIPVHVIEWWKRQSRIEHRPEDKMRPTLRRASVEEFGRWYLARHKTRADAHSRRGAEIERRQMQRAEPEWLTLVEAAMVIGCDPSTVSRYVRMGELTSRHLHGRPSLDRKSVAAFADRWRDRNSVAQRV